LYLWIGKLEESDPNLLDSLNVEEKVKAQKFKFDKQRNYFSYSRSLLRYILSVYTEIPPAEIEFVYGTNGKPSLAAHQNKKNINFNLSHSDGYFACAIGSSNEIGVDIENVFPNSKQVNNITKKFFLQTESDRITSKIDTEAYYLFYKYWTIKEAYIKAKGNSIMQLKEVPDLSHLSADEIGFINPFKLSDHSGFTVRISEHFYLATILYNNKYRCLSAIHI
jgi:4'-phosphopantetheinyl transferase